MLDGLFSELLDKVGPAEGVIDVIGSEGWDEGMADGRIDGSC
jgi:hypothetical protein